MIGPARLLAAGLLSACTAGLTVPADVCRGGPVPQLVGRNLGEVGFAPGLPHRVIIPGSTSPFAAPGTLLVRVDEKGWITAAGCAR